MFPATRSSIINISLVSSLFLIAQNRGMSFICWICYMSWGASMCFQPDPLVHLTFRRLSAFFFESREDYAHPPRSRTPPPNTHVACWAFPLFWAHCIKHIEHCTGFKHFLSKDVHETGKNSNMLNASPPISADTAKTPNTFNRVRLLNTLHWTHVAFPWSRALLTKMQETQDMLKGNVK